MYYYRYTQTEMPNHATHKLLQYSHWSENWIWKPTMLTKCQFNEFIIDLSRLKLQTCLDSCIIFCDCHFSDVLFGNTYFRCSNECGFFGLVSRLGSQLLGRENIFEFLLVTKFVFFEFIVTNYVLTTPPFLFSRHLLHICHFCNNINHWLSILT